MDFRADSFCSLSVSGTYVVACLSAICREIMVSDVYVMYLLVNYIYMELA